MRGTLYSKETKKVVRALRARGIAYSVLTKKYGIPKSTLSTWFSRNYPVSREKQRAHLARVRPLALEAVQRRITRENTLRQKKIAQLLKHFPTTSLPITKTLAAMLYWAEGAKGGSGLKFANTDPVMIKLFVTFLRKGFRLDESRFRVKLYLHYYHKPRELIAWWSKLLQIPKEKFAKPYFKKRSTTKRFRKNFAGICFISYLDSTIRKELLEIGRYIAKIYEISP